MHNVSGRTERMDGSLMLMYNRCYSHGVLRERCVSVPRPLLFAALPPPAAARSAGRPAARHVRWRQVVRCTPRPVPQPQSTTTHPQRDPKPQLGGGRASGARESVAAADGAGSEHPAAPVVACAGTSASAVTRAITHTGSMYLPSGSLF